MGLLRKLICSDIQGEGSGEEGANWNNKSVHFNQHKGNANIIIIIMSAQPRDVKRPIIIIILYSG